MKQNAKTTVNTWNLKLERMLNEVFAKVLGDKWVNGT